MKCIDKDCNRDIQDSLKFCPYCGRNQQLSAKNDQQPDAASQSFTKVYDAPPVIETLNPKGLATSVNNKSLTQDITSIEPKEIILRAGDKIWHFEDPEGEVKLDVERPLIVLDEQTIHLAHTDRVLTSEELLQDVRDIIESKGVPVDVLLCQAKWISDDTEARPRLVASLRNHRFSDFKVIMGLDYLGNWASFQLQVARQPETLRPQIPPTEGNAFFLKVVGILVILGGVYLFNFKEMGTNKTVFGGQLPISILCILLGIGAFIWSFFLRSKEKREKAAWEEKKRLEKVNKFIDRSTRSFKIDDLRLFSESMWQVFKAVSDRIVETGAKIVRIEGGKGDYFHSSGIEETPTTLRKSDAGELDV
ncbi:hypothetical protein [Desulforhabdus sp. TSK]|uniref:hypothetical protein n=1 Tax=Desulforhabdus sp. TSK TaxID=2925014 RepID=UPI001FC8182F|nr:hypothetical protein [Desulforhabdus sp. TSK]GKT09124.1 hypothetical protein DSTSK_24290 [Desulforhabdus sp. TSK]